jgi:DNA-binding transcriptional LysR family regulator
VPDLPQEPFSRSVDGSSASSEVLRRVLRLDLGLVRDFVRVCEVGSITRAAAVLGCSQPGLSQRLRSAEGVLGFELLDRGSRGVTPTVMGLLVLPYARVLLRVAEVLAGEVVAVEEGCGGW